MTMTIDPAEQARLLAPYLVELLTLSVGGASSGGGGGGGSSGYAGSPHLLFGPDHEGDLDPSQAPWAMRSDGSVALVGNLAVADGVTIDGIDISAHAASPDAHHAAFIGLTGNSGSAAPNGSDLIGIVGSDGITTSASGSTLTISGAALAPIARNLVAGAGLTGGGDLSADRTFNVGAGDGISVGADTVGIDSTVVRTTRQVATGIGLTGGGDLSANRTIAVNTAAAFTWTGLHTFQQLLTTRGIQPELSDAYELGAADKLWLTGWFANLDTLTFRENTMLLVGDRLLVCRSGNIATNVGVSTTQINFAQSMTVGSFVLFRGNGKTEYMQVGSLVSGTLYNVTRSVDPGSAQSWPEGTPYAVLGTTGTGRIEIQASNPRIKLMLQGATYSAETVLAILGDLYGYYGAGTSPTYGFAVGDYSGGNYLKYDQTNGFQIVAGGGTTTIDDLGILMSAGSSESVISSQIRWTDAANESRYVTFAEPSADYSIFAVANRYDSPYAYAYMQSEITKSPSRTAKWTMAARTGSFGTETFVQVGAQTDAAGEGYINLSNGPVTINKRLSVGTPAATPSNGDIAIQGIYYGSRIIASSITGARVYNSAAQSIPTGTNTALTFNSERYDADINGAVHDTGSNTSRLTSQTNGVYHISGTVALALDATGNYRRLGIRVNGSTFIALDARPPILSGSPTYMTISTDYILSPGTYVELVLFHDASGAINTVAGGNYSAEFMMHKIN